VAVDVVTGPSGAMVADQAATVPKSESDTEGIMLTMSSGISGVQLATADDESPAPAFAL
jgi:hypothetical protein